MVLVTAAAVALTSRCRCRVALRGAARGRPGTPAAVRRGPGKYRGTATCVRDPAPGEGPDGRRGSSRMPGCGPTSAAVHGTPAGRTAETAKNFLLRDHAPPQLEGPWELGAKRWHADGAHVEPGHAGFWPPRSDAVWPAAAPPASAAAGAGIRTPGSNAGLGVAVDTCVRSLCAGKSASAVVAAWNGNGTLAYDHGSPRERDLPRDSPGKTRQRFPRALCNAGKQMRQSILLRRNQTGKATG
jgi:hypothetical protein